MSNVDSADSFLGLAASDLGVPTLFEAAVDQQSPVLKGQLRRLIRPQEIADAICFMIANSAVSGELWADAGWHPAP